MKTIRETSKKTGAAHVTLVKYRNLNNVSHYHSDHELVYIHTGSALVTINRTPFCLSGGMCVFIHCNDIHYIQSDKNTVIYVMKIDSKIFENIICSKKLTSPLLEHTYSFNDLFDEIFAELHGRDEYCNTVIDCIVTIFLAQVFRREQTLPYSNQLSHKLNINEMYDDISKKIFSEYSTITFDEAAQYMHFSKPYFSKVFHNIFGMTFTQYLNTIKVSFAIEKLRAGNMSITEICANCGFNTIRNFNRVFKDLTGYSPHNLPKNYVYIRNLRDSSHLDPTLNCTEILT